ncbi:MAG: hypothetical protein GY841_23570 [FCB group bacterium]|nr:hypothetical protein [FCB group bacterium]
MIPENRLTDDKLKDLLKSGVRQITIAATYGLTRSAVSQRCRKLGIRTVAAVSEKAAAHIVNQNIEAVDQLHKINLVCNRLLDEVTGETYIVDELTNAVEGVLEAHELGDSGAMVAMLKGLIDKVTRDREFALKSCAEIREQLKLQAVTYQTMYSSQAMAEFKRAVIEEINATSPETKRRIVERLSRRRLMG